jgi:hypothetical protein
MQELRFVAVSEDGRYAVLAVPGRSARFTLPIDERLRAVALGQSSRLAQYEIEVESPLRPKEIQARIRAGETVEEIADAAGIAVERVRWFEGPVLAERAYAADQAQLASVRRQGDGIPSSPGPRLGEIVTERLKALGTDPEDAQWDARKLGDGNWQVHLTFTSGGRLHTAEWNFDPRRRHVVPADDNASRMSLPGGEPLQPAAPAPGEATVTHLAPRLSSAAVHGNGAIAGSVVGNGLSNGLGNGIGSGLGTGLGNGGRARQERPAPVRPSAPEPWVSEPRVSEPRISEPRISEPRVAELQAPEPRETEAPAAAAPAVATAPRPAVPTAPPPPVPSAPPVSPATVAAQVAEAMPAAPPGRHSQAPSALQPARHARPAHESRVTEDPQIAQEPRVAEARGEVAAPPTAVGREAPVPPAPAAEARTAEAPAPEAPATAPAAEPANEQAARQGRKTARGKRSSVPSWDEIMFGNSRQRDLSAVAGSRLARGS